MSHTGAITEDHKVFTWGGGWFGRLGLGNNDNQYLPQPVLSLQFKNCTEISCGAYHTMIVTDDGDLYVCGRGDSRLGLGEVTDKSQPELVSALRSLGVNAIKPCAAEEHSLLLASDGRVWSWGKDSYHKLGITGIHKTKFTLFICPFPLTIFYLSLI